MECGICFVRYLTKGIDSRPYILECGHTFCGQCILDLLKSNGECPQDHQKITKSFDEITVNYAMLESISNLPEKEQTAEVQIKKQVLLKTKSSMMEQQNFLKKASSIEQPKEEIKNEVEDIKVNAEVSIFNYKLVAEFPTIKSPAVLDALKKYGPFLEDAKDEEIQKNPPEGPYEYENGSVYLGQMKNGKKEGRGKQIWGDGPFYDGFWKNDLATGLGRFIHEDGEIYEGEWLNDKAHGKGKYIHCDGANYIGDWIEDQQSDGVETFADGAKYVGSYKEGKKNGKGEFYWADGSSYKGEFLKNNIHGFGEYAWVDGRRYIGDWLDNKMNGKGTFFWPNGRRYEGEYHLDKKQGYGIFYWADGQVFKGEWKDGKQHGNGFYCAVGGKFKQGEWHNGKRVLWIGEKETENVKTCFDDNVD